MPKPFPALRGQISGGVAAVKKFCSRRIAFPFKSRYTFFMLEHEMKYAIGIDGGGTKTRVDLCNTSGERLAHIVGGPSNFQIIGVEQAAATILELVERCLKKAACSLDEVGCIVAGLTGAGRAADQERMKAEVEAESIKRGAPFGRFVVESDARIGIEGAHAGRPGIIVICGTGSIVFGKDAKGNIHRAGGWGRIIGDEGGGFTVGRLALRAIARDLDGHKRTMMTGMAAREFKFDSPETIIREVYKENFDIASLVPIVLDAAKRKDKAARNILRRQAAELTMDIEQVAKKIRLPKTKTAVAFIGSIAAGSNFFSHDLWKRTRVAVKNADIVDPQGTPAHGAVLMALRRMEQPS